MSEPAPAPSVARPLYAAAIICPCGARLAIVETSAHNCNECAACGRTFSMSHPARRLGEGAKDNLSRIGPGRVTERQARQWQLASSEAPELR